jgi:single-stranded-DNA-specific exonuclease
LIKYGGHAAAAGFTIDNDKLECFRQRLLVIAEEVLADKILTKTIAVDAEINLRGVTPKLVEEIQDLQPFGYSNPTPKFVSRALTIKHQTTVGKDGSHLKIKLFDGKQVWDAIGFGLGSLAGMWSSSTKVDLVYGFEYNTWNGIRSLQLNVKDIRPSEG